MDTLCCGGGAIDTTGVSRRLATHTHLGRLVGDTFARDLPRRVLADPRLAEGVLHPADLKPAVVHPQAYMLEPRVRFVEVVHLVRVCGSV